MREAETISRRALLGGAALAVSAAATISASTRAAAQQKVSQADAKYQDQPKEQQRCEICLNFQPPSACQFVESPINPKGWCQFFAAKENAH
jgi:secreted PhoX family phosphatase